MRSVYGDRGYSYQVTNIRAKTYMLTSTGFDVHEIRWAFKKPSRMTVGIFLHFTAPLAENNQLL
jgi:hypothetical protein